MVICTEFNSFFQYLLALTCQSFLPFGSNQRGSSVILLVWIRCYFIERRKNHSEDLECVEKKVCLAVGLTKHRGKGCKTQWLAERRKWMMSTTTTPESCGFAPQTLNLSPFRLGILFSRQSKTRTVGSIFRQNSRCQKTFVCESKLNELRWLLSEKEKKLSISIFHGCFGIPAIICTFISIVVLFDLCLLFR